MKGHRLPPGVRRARDQRSAPITQAETRGDAHFMAKGPELVGIPCQIQHPLQPTDKPESRPGLLGCGVMLTDGQPLFLIQLKHADGTSLVAVLEVQDFVDWGELFAALPEQAHMAMAKAAGRG